MGGELFIATDGNGRALARLAVETLTGPARVVSEGERARWTIGGHDYVVTRADTAGDAVYVGVLPDRAPLEPEELRQLLTLAPSLAPHDLLDWLRTDLVTRAAGDDAPVSMTVRRVDAGADLSGWPAVRKREAR